MAKAAVLVLVLAACGGKSKPADPVTPPATEVTSSEAAASASQPTPPDDGGALAQVALAEQYELGKKVYTEKKCDTCHGANGEGNPKNPAVIGANAYPEQPAKTAKLRKGIVFKTAGDVLGFVKKHMPIKEPGTLSDEEAAAVTSWMLSETKVNITQKLDATNAASINLR